MHEQIEHLETLRHRANIWKGFLFIVSAIAIGVAFFFIFGDMPLGTEITMMVFLVFGIFFSVFYYKSQSKFVRAYKEFFALKVFESIFENISYEPEEYFTKELIESTYITSLGNRYSGDDLLSASYRGVPFQQCDLLIQNKGYGKYSTTVTYFKGKWMIFDFHKSFQGYVQVRQKQGKTVKPGMFSDKPLTQKVAMENMIFNQIFDIRASDDKLAFYLLTPHVLESIMELEKKFDGQMIFAFIDGKLHIALNNGKNAMEPSLSTQVTEAAADFILEEMKIIMHFIDVLLQEQVMQAAIKAK